MATQPQSPEERNKAAKARAATNEAPAPTVAAPAPVAKQPSQKEITKVTPLDDGRSIRKVGGINRIFDPRRRGGTGLAGPAGAPKTPLEASTLEESAEMINATAQLEPVVPTRDGLQPKPVQQPTAPKAVTADDDISEINRLANESIDKIKGEATVLGLQNDEINQIQAQANKEIARIKAEEKMRKEAKAQLGKDFNEQKLNDKIDAVTDIAASQGVDFNVAEGIYNRQTAARAKLDPSATKSYDRIISTIRAEGFDANQAFEAAVTEYESDGVDADDMKNAHDTIASVYGKNVADIQQDEFLINTRGMDRASVEGDRKLLNTKRLGDSIVAGTAPDTAVKSQLDQLVSIGRTDLVPAQVGKYLTSPNTSNEAKRLAVDFLADIQGGAEKKFITMGNQIVAVDQRTGAAEVVHKGTSAPKLQVFGDSLYSFDEETGDLNLLTEKSGDKTFQTIGNQVFAFDPKTGQSQLVAEGEIQKDLQFKETAGGGQLTFDPETGEVKRIKADEEKQLTESEVKGKFLAGGFGNPEQEQDFLDRVQKLEGGEDGTQVLQRLAEDPTVFSNLSQGLKDEAILAGFNPPDGASLTPNQRVNLENRILADYKDSTKQEKKAIAQVKIMRASLAQARKAVKEGTSLNAASQGVVITFNKILDPTSVVRESEYARSGAGQSFLARMDGMVQKFKQGGAGLTIEGLEEFASVGEEFMKGYQESLRTNRSLALNRSDKYGLDIESFLPDAELSRFKDEQSATDTTDTTGTEDTTDETGQTNASQSILDKTNAAIDENLPGGQPSAFLENKEFDVISKNEGFDNNAYRDSGGVPTIGFGFTTIGGKPVVMGQTITDEEAKAEYAKQAPQYRTWNDHISIPLADEEKAQLTSFTWNLGPDIWNTDDGQVLAGLIDEGEFGLAAEEMLKYNKIKNPDFQEGVTPETERYIEVAGLTNRRERESAAFQKFA